MRIPCRNKKAVSTVIATLLMILVVMIGMTVAFAYVVDYVNGYKAGAGTSVLESMTIEDAWIMNNHTVQLSIYNTGTAANLGTDSGVDITLTSIYVNGVALTDPSSNSNDFSSHIIPAGSHGVITCSFSTPNAFILGYTYNFKILTQRGSNFITQVQYGSQ